MGGENRKTRRMLEKMNKEKKVEPLRPMKGKPTREQVFRNEQKVEELMRRTEKLEEDRAKHGWQIKDNADLDNIFTPVIAAVLRGEGIRTADEVAKMEVAEFINKCAKEAVDNGTLTVLQVLEMVTPGLMQLGMVDAPLVIEMGKNLLYRQLEEMHEMNLNKDNIKMINPVRFNKMSIQECMKHTFFYRDFLLDMPLGDDGKEQVYYIALPSVRIRDGLDGMLISNFSLGWEFEDEKGKWEKSETHIADYAGSGAVVDLGSLYYVQAAWEGDKPVYVAEFGASNFRGCDVIGRLYTSCADDAAYIASNVDWALPEEYLERVMEFHRGNEESLRLLEAIRKGDLPKRVQAPEKKSLVDWDLSEFGSRFPREAVELLKAKKIPFSFRGEAKKNRWLGECWYRANTGKWKFKFDVDAVSKKIAKRGEINGHSNPTVQAYVFRAAVQHEDWQLLAWYFGGGQMVESAKERGITSENIEEVQDVCLKMMSGIKKGSNWFSQIFGNMRGEYEECINYKEEERMREIWESSTDERRDFFDRFAIEDDVKKLILEMTPLEVVKRLTEQINRQNEIKMGGGDHAGR